MEFRILGPLQVLDEGRPVELAGAKQRALLASLLLRRGETVSAERLIEDIWGDERPANAVKALQVHVSRLRKSFDECALETRSGGYALRVAPDELDLYRFEGLVERGRELLHAGDPQSASTTLRAALALWRGPPLADFAYDEFAQGEIGRLEELRLNAVEEHVEADLALGRHAALAGELERLVEEHPLRERLRGQLMLGLYRAGRQAEALDVYREGRSRLVAELGIEPCRALQELEQAILRQDVRLEAPPPPASLDQRGAFVGRDEELEQLRAGLAEAAAGRGRLFLVSGEPGIGKSRLTEELAAAARSAGARVLVGRCWEAGGAPAYWPWLQALRAYVRDRETVVSSGELGRYGAELTELLPELGLHSTDTAEPARVDPETARFRLFDATASLLRAAAEEQPVVVVLDDLHAADTPSLLLLEFVAAHADETRLLVVGAYRDAEPTLHDPLATTLSTLMRLPATRLLRLGGIGEEDVSRFVELSCDVTPAARLVERLHRETEGNPFFVGEVVRLLASEGALEAADLAELAIPDSVRAAIRRRLGALPDETNRILALASVLGRDFDVDTLARLSGTGAGEVLGLLDEAIAAKIVTDVHAALGRLRFSHALVRDALYDELPAARRVSLHLEAGEALEERYRGDVEPHLAELAHHFVRAAPAGHVDRAVEYAQRAGRRSVRLLAYEEAVRLFELALQALALAGDIDPGRQCVLLLDLGDAQARAGNFDLAKATFLRVAEIATHERMSEHLGRAAIGYGGRFVWDPGRGDPHLVRLLEQALEALPAADSDLRIRLMARLAGGPLTDEPAAEERRAALSRDAVEMARRLAGPAALAYALDARWTAIWAPHTLEERAAIAAEVVQTAAAAGDKELMHDGHIWRSLAALELGDLDSVHAELRAQARLAEELRQPAQLWFGVVLRGTLATFEGRFADAEELIPRALTLGDAAGLIADVYRTIQVWALRREQGRLPEVERALEDAVRRFPMYDVLHCIRAHVAAEAGRLREAREALHALAADGFAALPRNDDWLFALCLLADVSREAADPSHARLIYELLLPYAARNAVNPPAACIGSVSRSLGVAAALDGRVDEAARHFDEAIAMNEAMGARPWAERTRRDRTALLD